VNAALLLYATMVVAASFQEEFAPLAGALAAHHGHGEIWLVGVACAVGSWLHGVVLFHLGRTGRTILQRSALERQLKLVREHPVKAMLGTRFLYGIRLTLPVACGAAGLGFGRFAFWTAIAALAWAGLFAAIGWIAGEAAIRLMYDLRHFEIPLGVALLAAGVVFWLWRRSRAPLKSVA
jgi:membrane protein DedA with SNARE-associated domain